ncbi:enoyl-CoA hydratase/isomerase family protein [Streptomyces sp. NPDC048291]|uniref:enoyl-CoA hydratase/isomerase family protein n=1 Tax=Streptomyces sp. NPDC048291 TaxID=3365530 RepID=UPI00371EDF29
MEDTRDLAKQLGKLAGELGTALGELERIECGAWKGKTAITFTDYIDKDVTPLVRKSHDSFDKASRALHRWADDLHEFQVRADRLEKSAGEKLDAKADAQAKVGSDGSMELAKASSAVDGVIQKVHELEEEYRRAARQIGKELDKAADIAPDEPGFWDKLGHGIEDAWNATGKWLEDHADLIKMVGDILSDLTAVLGLLAIITLPFEPLGAIFGAAAILTSGLALLSHSIAMAAGADVTWMQLGLDALGLLPGIGAFGKEGVVVEKGVAESAETIFGAGFKDLGPAASRNFVSFGEKAEAVMGGKRVGSFGKTVALWGKSPMRLVGSDSTKLNRLAGVMNAGYRQGQTLGTKSWNLLTPEKMAVDPFSKLGRGIDGAFKIGPKAVSIVSAAHEHFTAGDRLDEAATAH